jgi:type II secretory pathway component PulC
MTQGLWIVNSSLLIVFWIALFVNSTLKQTPPILRLKRVLVDEIKKKPEPIVGTIKSWEKIYKSDVFGTFVQPEVSVVKQNFITPIPEPKTPIIIPPPEIKKNDFIAPLNLTVRGIVVSADETQSIAMITDEAGKESIYHLGENIKDAQVIKIAHNRIVLIRANGQHETFYLRKEDVPIEQKDKLVGIVKKINDQNYEIDPDALKEEIESLGHFIEHAAIIGTTYTQGVPIGIRIGKLNADNIGTVIGLLEYDIITSINKINTSDAKERMKIYDIMRTMKIGDIINVELIRANKNITITYKLAKLEKPRKPIGSLEKKPEGKPGDELKMNATQQREQNIREFSKQHGNQRNRETLIDIRKRLLENLHTRLRNARVR